MEWSLFFLIWIFLLNSNEVVVGDTSGAAEYGSIGFLFLDDFEAIDGLGMGRLIF